MVYVLCKIYANVDFYYFKFVRYNPKGSRCCCIYNLYPETIFIQTAWI
jgi:hypothetical protein